MSAMAGLRICVFLFIAAVAMTASARAGADEQHAALPPTSSWRMEMLRQINVIRLRHGVRPLHIDDRLNRAAQYHADDMAKRDYFDHRSPDGARMTERADRTGYHWRRLIENIAAGYPNIAATIQGWMESPEHRAGLLDDNVRDAGFGYVYVPHDGGRVRKEYYWTLLVGRE